MKIIKKVRKMISILMIAILVFSGIGIFTNKANAATYLIKEADLYSKGEMVSFKYNGIGVGVEFVVYRKDGIEYPAYCLNRRLDGVTTEVGASITVNKAVENAAVWRAVTNGYPFKTPAELGCNTEAEAFAATKMAVYDALYTYDLTKFEAINDEGTRVISAIKTIVTNARSSTASKPVGIVNIKPVTENWKSDELENKYISKTYKVETNVESTKYTINLDGFTINGVKLADMNNREKTEFSSGEVFKVLIPVSELENKLDISTEFQITATANLRTKPVLYGETEDSDFQNYAIAAGEWEFEDTTLTTQYPSNKTTIRIIKADNETKENLEGAKFNILDENKNIVFSDVATNEEGVVEIKGINPGKYFIEEMLAPDGYTKYDENIEIDVEFNEIYTVKVNNFKKPEENEKNVEEEEITVVSKKEVALPRTGF